ncbi:uncharacterized protein PG986_001506 [Apiospora aurea]|uniref:Uncharacterized protein n=1 Tax=Apiospora aurea TaxID=335848 RepID=A0ABR1QX74_9PEZI
MDLDTIEEFTHDIRRALMVLIERVPHITGTMKPLLAFSVVALATLGNALIRFQCSQLVIERLDPS